MNDSAFSLSEQQIRFFETFGYLGFPGLMADRIDEITEAFEAVWSERGGGHTASHTRARPVRASCPLSIRAPRSLRS